MSIIGNERGSSLLISLMVLCLLTLLGTAGLMTSNTESKITHHLRKFEQAFYAADAGSEMVRCSIADPGDYEPGDEKDIDLGSVKAKVTFFGTLDLGWGIFLLNIQSEGSNPAGNAKRLIRIDLQRVENSGGPVDDNTDENDYEHGSESATASVHDADATGGGSTEEV